MGDHDGLNGPHAFINVAQSQAIAYRLAAAVCFEAVMDFKRACATFGSLKAQRDIWALFAAVCFSAVLLNGVAWYQVAQNRQIVLVPLNVHRSLSYSDHPSSAYLEALTHYFVFTRFNITPSKTRAQHRAILAQVHPKAYDTMAQTLMKEAAVYAEQQLSSGYHIESIKINVPQRCAFVKGTIFWWLQGTIKEKKALSLKLVFTPHLGALTLSSFGAATHAC